MMVHQLCVRHDFWEEDQMTVHIAPRNARKLAVMATVTAALMLGACAQTGDALQAGLLGSKDTANDADKPQDAASLPKSELEKATEYWGKKYKEKPTDLEPALSYAKNLKAMGERQQALAIIQQAAVYHGQDKGLASEYGRLALELDQISVAKQMLAVADDPLAPDWRVISARGTIFAKEGKYKEAIPLYERALMLSQEQTSVMNNLAMAYAMAGEANKAEDVLRRIEAKGGNAKSRQNLALVLGLQGKFEESKAISAQTIGAESANADTDYLKRMVKVDTKAVSAAAVASVEKTSRSKTMAAAPQIKPAVAEGQWQSDTVPSKVADMTPQSQTLKGMTP
jgi:Flp pilus assembly protein TadD